jgi:acyl carrier protein
MNKENEILEFIVSALNNKMERAGLSKNDLSPGFNLTKSGLLDSMSFVTLITQLEKNYKVEIDFEKAFQREDFSTVSGLIHIISNEIK